MEIYNTHISNRRSNADGHGGVEMTAFNTDGFDVSGDNVHIHDCSIWNQDDCIAVKDGSSNMLFERIEASGLGLTIGSIGGSYNNNITFRDCHMHKTSKGIYMKFRGSGGVSRLRLPPGTPAPPCVLPPNWCPNLSSRGINQSTHAGGLERDVREHCVRPAAAVADLDRAGPAVRLEQPVRCE
eukprot:SAG22_NODE_987_length_6142_cov_3.152242_3_plen_183_part_00